MTILRFAVWLWSIGWLSYSASTIPDGNALGTWISVCCFATGVVIDAVLTAGDASPVGDGGEGVSRIAHDRARRAGGRERRTHSPLLRELGSQE
jgi:hypothetical protein